MRNKHQYSEEWQDTIRPRILKRDNYKCIKCGIAHRQYVLIDQQKQVIKIDHDEYVDLKKEGRNTYRVFLQVSHKNHDKSDNRDENLQSLCPRCHQAFDRIHKNLMRNSVYLTDYVVCTDKACPWHRVSHKHTSKSGAVVIIQ